MNPVAVVALVFGLIVGFTPMFVWHNWQEDKRALAEAKAQVEQEKRNVEIVTHYADMLNGVTAWYRDHPVRVRIQGREASSGCPAPRAEDIILTVGGVKGSDSATTDSGLLSNDGTGAKPN